MIEAIILAGGFGKRLRPVVKDVPKPMAKINGKPFLEWQMRYWLKKGINRFILAVGYKYQAIESYFGNQFEEAEISYSVEDKPLGTGGGVLLAKKKIKSNGPFLILNGDTYFDVDLKSLVDFHLSRECSFTMSLFRTLEKGRYDMVEITDDGQVLSLKSQAGTGLANGGVSLASSDAFDGMEETSPGLVSLEKDLLTSIIRKKAGKVYGVLSGGDFIDIGIPEDFQRAKNMIPARL